MSTRCLIAIPSYGQGYQSIYCHFDGYDSAVGAVLRQNYNTLSSAEALIELGDLSYVRADKVCAYHRDRGDSWHQTQPKFSSSEQALLSLAEDCGADYLYILIDDGWQTLKV